MGTITAKDLKQKTGEAIKRVKAGERLILTYRGRPVAVIEPTSEKQLRASGKLRPFDEAWRDIEDTLAKTKPPFDGWQEATRWVRDGNSS
jgi:prevent-host-death family protein